MWASYVNQDEYTRNDSQKEARMLKIYDDQAARRVLAILHEEFRQVHVALEPKQSLRSSDIRPAEVQCE